jgi:hypothetical protein
MSGFHCATCGKYHAELPMSFGSDAPSPWDDIPEDQREGRGELTSDLCIIDDEHFFIRGRLLIPVRGSAETFCWLVWVSLSRSNFKRTCDLWETKGRESEPPYFGWLCSELPGYSEPTLHLKTNVQTGAVGERPRIELEPTLHPLAVEQREGISHARLRAIVEIAMHGSTAG